MLSKLNRHQWLLLAILAIAAFTRLYKLPDYMEFLGDQGRDMVIIRDFLKNGNLFFIGPQTSIGNMYLGPYYYYLVSPFLFLFNFNPIGPSVFVALLSILTAYLTYKFSSQWFNRRTGLIAAFLFSLSPVVIKYSNFSWNPNVMPLFSLLFFYFISKASFKNQPQALLPATLSFIMAMNSHYLALLLLPPASIFLLIQIVNLYKSKNKLFKVYIKYLLISLGTFFLSLTPLVLFDLKHDGQNIKAFLTFFTDRQTTVNLKAYKAIPHFIPLSSQIFSRLITAKNTLIGSIFTAAIFIFSCLRSYFFLKNKSFKDNPHFFLIISWILLGVIGLGLYKQHIYDHYFGFLFPSVFILAALFFDYLCSRNGLLKLFSYFLLIFLIVLSISENPLRYSAPKQLSYTKEIVNSIIQESNGEPFNLALLAKQNYDPPYRYFFYESKAGLFDLHDKMTQQLFVICEPWQIECQPINNPQWEIAAFGWAKIDKSWEISGIKIFKLVHTENSGKN
ncbi:MAG: ArnT family glycosyltransferase [Patescibacteria group bacterium]